MKGFFKTADPATSSDSFIAIGGGCRKRLGVRVMGEHEGSGAFPSSLDAGRTIIGVEEDDEGKTRTGFESMKTRHKRDGNGVLVASVQNYTTMWGDQSRWRWLQLIKESNRRSREGKGGFSPEGGDLVKVGR